MKTDRLEEFIKNNRNEFDFREPSPVVWEKISEKNSPKKNVLWPRYLIRIAAVFAIIVATSAIIWKSGTINSLNIARTNTDPEIRELIEAEAFYAQQVNTKLKEIQKCYYTNPELKNDIESDLSELEDMYKVLKTDLKENVSNKAVIEAMIENNRFRLKLVDDILEQIKC